MFLQSVSLLTKSFGILTVILSVLVIVVEFKSYTLNWYYSWYFYKPVIISIYELSKQMFSWHSYIVITSAVILSDNLNTINDFKD